MKLKAGRTVVATVSMTLLSALIPLFIATPAAAAKVAAADCRNVPLAETDALKQAKSCKAKVEILGLRTEKAKYFANPDGTRSFEITNAPVRVKKNGAWHDIDTTLKKEKDDRWAPKAAADVSFSNGGDGPFMVSTVEGKRFELSWPGGKLAKPEIKGATAIYPEVAKGVDLAVTATSSGYTHTLVVKTREAALSPALAKVRFAMSGEARLRGTPQDELELVDAGGKSLGLVSHASAMWDSSLDPAVGGEVQAGATTKNVPLSTAKEPGPTARIRQISVTAQGDDLFVTPDVELLKTGVLPLYIDPPFGINRAAWAYATSTNSNWTPGEHARVGRNPDDGRRFRSFFGFDVSGLAGTQILSNGFALNLDHTAACAGNTAYLYIAGGIGGGYGSRVAWSHPISGPVGSAWGQSNEAGGCGSDQGDDPINYGSNDHMVWNLQNSINSWSQFALGLCMCSDTSGTNENGQYQWMKFHHDVNSGPGGVPRIYGSFNRAPGTPADLKTSGTACGSTIATNQPQLRAQYVDPDGDQTLNATFYWKELPSGGENAVTGPAKPANNYGDVTLNLGAAAEGKSYSWRVVTTDGISGTQGSSGWCDFTVNTGPPPHPVVTSSNYPSGSTPNGGPGIPGTFTLSNGGPSGLDVTTYFYGWSDPPTYSINVSPGASANINIAPPRHGYNVLHVYSREPSGITSPTTHYSFLTNSPSAPVAHWPLDDIAGHGLNDQMGTRDLSGPNSTWTPDVRYVGTQGLTLNDGAKLSTANAVDTSKSFAISAWVRLTDTSNQDNAIISQEGTNTSGFILYTSGQAKDKIWFLVFDNDNTAVVGTWVSGPLTVGVWTHVLATYDSAENQVRIWVNGMHAQTANRSGTPWNATGPVHVGWAKFGNGQTMQKGIGNVADIRIWNRSASDDDIYGANALPGQQATTGVITAQEVGTWDFGDGDVLDGSYWSRNMTMEGNATFANPGHDDNGAFSLNGTAGRAVTSGPVVRTDQQLSIAAWVKADQYRPDNQVIAGNGQTVSLWLDGGDNKWHFTVATPDGQGGNSWATAVSNQPAVLGQWQHLIGTFDPASGQTRLYLNGWAQSAHGANGRGSYNPATPFEVGAQNGATHFFGGQIDQVKVFRGWMSEGQARNLYGEHDQLIINLGSGRCLDSPGSANGTQIHLWDCHAGSNQKFVMQASGAIVNPATGMCLDAEYQTLASRIVMHDCHGGVNQLFQYRADGTLYMPNVNMCVDVQYTATNNGSKLMLYTCHGGGSQIFSNPARA